MTTALIVVDVQNDFADTAGAALPVAGGATVAARITAHLQTEGANYGAVAATRDWHIDPGTHFSADPDFVDRWPPHCVADSKGAEFHAALDMTRIDEVFSKGAYSASYTGFDGQNSAGVPLGEWLTLQEVDKVTVVGLATDYCVKATALDAAAAGMRTSLLADLTAGVAQESTTAALAELAAAGVTIR